MDDGREQIEVKADGEEVGRYCVFGGRDDDNVHDEDPHPTQNTGNETGCEMLDELFLLFVVLLVFFGVGLLSRKLFLYISLSSG